jgi:hypothetical protein
VANTSRAAKGPIREVMDASSVREAVSVAVGIATLQTTQQEHERRISSLERFQYALLFFSLSAAIGSTGTLIMFIIEHLSLPK